MVDLTSVKIKILDERIKNAMPAYATTGSAGLDLRACIDSAILIQPDQVVRISSGIALYIENQAYAALVLPRSGTGSRGLVLGNLVGLIDSDYQGELSIVAWNRTRTAIPINPLDRIAQLTFVPIATPQLEIVEEFPETGRGEGGFGSTGLT